MAIATGHGGSASIVGISTPIDIKTWRYDIQGAPQVVKELTTDPAFVVTDVTCPQFSAKGQFTADLIAGCDMATSISGISSMFGWTVNTTCEADQYAVAGDQWTYATPGYISGNFEVRAVNNSSSTAVVGDTGTYTFTQATGNTIAGAAGITTQQGTNGDGQRERTYGGVFSGTITGTNLPIAGAAGAISMASSNGTDMAGNVIVTGVTITVDRTSGVPRGMITIDWVGNGELAE